MTHTSPRKECRLAEALFDAYRTALRLKRPEVAEHLLGALEALVGSEPAGQPILDAALLLIAGQPEARRAVNAHRCDDREDSPRRRAGAGPR